MSTTVGTLKDNSGNDFLPVTDVSLVAGLEDISTIRSGAALGATAYQLPSGGIPASDLASGVIPTVPVISTDIDSDATSDTKTTSPKAVKTFVENKGYTTNTGTVTGITVGTTAYTPVGGVVTIPSYPSVPVQDVTVDGTSVVSNGTAVIPKEIFVVIYGTTTYLQSVDAYTSGKIVVCLYNNNIYTLTHITNTYVGFSAYWDKLAYLVKVTSGDVWSSETNSLQSTYDRVSTLSGYETSTVYYPNCKAVYDSLPIAMTTTELNNLWNSI